MNGHVDTIRISNTTEGIRQAILENLIFIQGKSEKLATRNDWYMAVAYAVRDRLMKNWIDHQDRLESKKLKVVGYLSAEFLMGPHLGNALINLGIEHEVFEAMQQLGLDPHDIINQEEEPGLGNGGLGRLAACYMDSLSTLGVPAIGYGIRYEFGIFDQKINDGWQEETTDKWLHFGNPWEIARPELTYKVKFGGRVVRTEGQPHKEAAQWMADYEIKGVAHDTPVPGFHNNIVNMLRLWKSEAIESFNFNAFNTGDYYGAVDKKIFSETLTKVLYPNDELEKGKRLRLSQQYFFVSCSLQDMIHIQGLRQMRLEDLPEVTALQMNDTHPSIAVAELMRLLVDENGMEWDTAWNVTQRTLAYTNHTLLPEALERWSLPLFSDLLPRHLEIIYEINDWFLRKVSQQFPDDPQLLGRVSMIDEQGQKSVRMAHLATIGSHAINGVSALHTELLKQTVMADFYKIQPEQFHNVTNGVTPRRWMRLYNPDLSRLITSVTSERWVTHLEDELVHLTHYAEDPDFLHKWQQIKLTNKRSLAQRIQEQLGVVVDPDSLFDIQVKRIHEYKRQHLNVLHILTLYNRIRQKRDFNITPRTFVFGGKAAPGYFMAKLMIKLITTTAEVIQKDPLTREYLRVVFYPDFNVKNSEWIYRAADLSEQISTAGKEASGTGNMKFAMNGALTIGTLDGANVEILEQVGHQNFFLFGATVEELEALRNNGYTPQQIYQQNAELKEVIDLMQSDSFTNGNPDLFKPLIQSLLTYDPFFLMEDYASYLLSQQAVSDTYKNSLLWAKMSVMNVAGMGRFSSDRSIREYCSAIWNVAVS